MEGPGGHAGAVGSPGSLWHRANHGGNILHSGRVCYHGGVQEGETII